MDYRSLFNQAGSAFGTNPNLLYHIARLESSFNPTVQNNWDSNAQAGIPSYGLMQFIQPTFNSFYDKARSANPDVFKQLGSKNWKDPKQQAYVASWAMANGLGSHWATYDRARSAMGQGMSDVGDVSGGPYAATYTQRQTMSPEQARRAAAPGASSLRSAWKDRQKQTNAEMSGYQNEVLRQTGMQQPGSAGIVGGSLESMPRREGEAGWQYLQRLGQSMFGLRNDPGNSQTTGGRHTRNSRHYSGNAIDFGDARNSWAQLNAWFKWLQQNREALGLRELLNEGDHIHAAF